MIYYVDDIRNFGSGSNVKTIEANTPLEAVKKFIQTIKFQEIIAVKWVI